VFGSDGPRAAEDDGVSGLVDAARAASHRLADAGEDLASGAVSELLAAAVRLYAVASERRNEGLGGAELLVTPTEAVTVAAALLRSQQLTPFEFAIWFSNTRGARGMEEFE
jgi:hypothetical protein